MKTIINRNSKGQNIAEDFIGMKFGRLLIVEKTNKRYNGYVIWRARCECGVVIEQPSYRFKRGLSSCGCGHLQKGRPRIPNNGAHVNALFSSYKKSAKDRDILFDLTKEQARAYFEDDCAYCGAKPNISCTHPNLSGEYAWNGIDRVDSKQGYVSSNCVSCCTTCNWAKLDRTVNEFKDWIQRAYKHLF